MGLSSAEMYRIKVLRQKQAELANFHDTESVRLRLEDEVQRILDAATERVAALCRPRGADVHA